MRKKVKGCIHCSATKETTNYSFEDCKKGHLKRGFTDIGYNLYITKDGVIHQGRPFGNQLAHAKGHNTGFIAICYEGGLDTNGNPKDTRTPAQKQALIACKLFLERMFDVEEWMGHRDLSPDVNHDGQITPDEWMKSCPCFDVKSDPIFS